MRGILAMMIACAGFIATSDAGLAQADIDKLLNQAKRALDTKQDLPAARTLSPPTSDRDAAADDAAKRALRNLDKAIEERSLRRLEGLKQ